MEKSLSNIMNTCWYQIQHNSLPNDVMEQIEETGYEEYQIDDTVKMMFCIALHPSYNKVSKEELLDNLATQYVINHQTMEMR